MKAALLALLVAAPAAAQTFQVGVATTAYLAAETPVLFRGGLPDLKADVLGSSSTDFAVVDAKLDGGTWTWTVVPLSTGTTRFTARFVAKDGSVLLAATPDIAVKEADLGQDPEVLDIKSPARARPALWPFFLAALLGAAAYWGWRKWKERALPGMAPPPPAPPRPPEEVAEEAIAKLSASGLWERDPAAYYLELTGILRAYLEARYGQPATAMTSPEVARLVKDRARDLKTGAAVRELLSRADLVKFAKATPDAGDGAKDAESALGVVRATTPAPQKEPVP